MDSTTYEQEGRDNATNSIYFVSGTKTEVLDSTVLPINGLLIRFKYNFFAGDHPNSRFTLNLSGEISRELWIPLYRLLRSYKLPWAAVCDTMGLIFRLYGGPNMAPREDIQASVEINAYGYAPPDHRQFDGLEEETFLPLRALESLRPTTRASRDAIEALEKVAVREGDVKETSCAVCLEEFVVGSEATRMPCSHVFHGDCIVRWLKNGYFCPLCRFELPIATIRG